MVSMPHLRVAAIIPPLTAALIVSVVGCSTRAHPHPPNEAGRQTTAASEPYRHFDTSAEPLGFFVHGSIPVNWSIASASMRETLGKDDWLPREFQLPASDAMSLQRDIVSYTADSGRLDLISFPADDLAALIARRKELHPASQWQTERISGRTATLEKEKDGSAELLYYVPWSLVPTVDCNDGTTSKRALLIRTHGYGEGGGNGQAYRDDIRRFLSTMTFSPGCGD